MATEDATAAAAPAADQTQNLPATVEVRAGLALNSTQTEIDLRELLTKHAGITEIKNKAGREQAHGAAMELMRARTAIGKAADAAREDATKFSKAVIAEAARLTLIVEPEEKRLKGLRDAWDEAEAKRKKAEEEAERARVLAISEKIAGLRAPLNLVANCRSSERIQALYDKLAAEVIDESYAEFQADAERIKAEILAQIKIRLDDKLATEAAQRAAAEAKERAEAEERRLAEQRAELERQQAELREAQAALERERAELAAASAPTPAPAPVEAPATAPIEQPVDDADDSAAAPSSPPLETEVVTLRVPVEVAAAVQEDPKGAVQALAEAVTDTSDWPRADDVAIAPSLPAMDRPSDAEIITVLALQFGVQEPTVIDWLLDMDLKAASVRVALECTT